MEYLRFNKPSVNISRVGFGCCPLGGHGWGETNEKDFFDAISHAIDLGINFFDTADVYGLGLSEKRLGKIIKSQRQKVIIGSKFGVRFDSKGNRFFDNSKAWLKEALHGSLKRLSTDYIDLYQVHYWDGLTPLAELFESLEQCIKEGKILKYGVSNINIEEHASINLSNLSTFSFEFSLIARHNESIIKKMFHKNKDILFLSWGSLAQGLLSGKYEKTMKFPDNDRRSRETYPNFRDRNFEKNLSIVEELKKIQQDFYPDKTISQIAIRWILDYFPFSVSLVGIKNSEQIYDIANCLEWYLDMKHVESLNLNTQNLIENSHA